jgi:asparagine synthase (glutamine-hydrolysing)
MSAEIAHRGPDDDGVYWDADQRLGVAHRRLSILDLSAAGHQPMWSVDRSICIVFNGEIYNFRELRGDLARTGFAFRSQSDTEVLLNLYLHKGESMLAELNGIFALAIWDTRARSLFLARDGLGVKPLYYAETQRGFLFASELKALLQEPTLPRDVDTTALRSFATFLWCPAPDTLLRGVKKLPPGHAMMVRDGRIERQWRFYKLPFGVPIAAWSDDAAVERVRSALGVAIARQMVADVPVGAFLSGGVDSSAVVAIAKAHSNGPLPCFTIASDTAAERREGFASDLPYAQSVARHLGVDLNVVSVGPEMADELPKMIYHLDEPQADAAPLNVLFISRLARQHGIKVLLSGAGGDDIFSGYRRHRAMVLEKYWDWLPNSVRRFMCQVARHLPTRPATLRRAAKAFQYAGFNGDERLASYFYWLEPGSVHALLSPELRAAAGPWHNPLLASLAELPFDVPALNRMLYIECRHFLADHNLNYTDKMSMATGVEVRVPLLDTDLVDLAARLPLRCKQRGAVGKWVLKQAMKGILPQEIIDRPKTGFGVPLRTWLHGPLKTLLADVLSHESIRRRGWFDPGAVGRLVMLDRGGRVDGAYSLFSILCMELWARSFLDGNAARA